MPKRTILRWASTGVLPALKLGRTVRIPLSALETVQSSPVGAPEPKAAPDWVAHFAGPLPKARRRRAS